MTLKTLTELFNSSELYDDRYFLDLISHLFSKTNNFKVIEALTFVEMVQKDPSLYVQLFVKVTDIDESLGHPLFDDELSFVSEDEDTSISESETETEITEITEITESSVSSESSDEPESSESSESSDDSFKVQKNFRKPNDEWKYRTKNLGISYTPDVLNDVEISFTGDLENFGRSEAIQWVNNLGGKGKDHVTKTTTFVVVGKNPGKTKFDLIKKYGTKTMDEDTFIRYLKKETSEKLEFSEELKGVVLCSQLKKGYSKGVSVCLDVPESLVEMKSEITKSLDYEFV